MVCARCGAEADAPVLPVDTDARARPRVEVDVVSVRVNDIREIARVLLCHQCIAVLTQHLRRVLYPAGLAAA